MTPLARIQGDFQDHLLRGSEAVREHVLGTARVPVETRLGIYAGAYGSRLIDALRSNYPALAALLGEADFEALGAEYVRTHDSPFFSIRNYGDVLAEFLTQHPTYAEVPVLCELARWEWMLGGVFDAADAAPLTAAALGSVAPGDWAQLRFEWHPGVRRIALVWNVPQLWQALTDERERPELSLLAEPVEWLAWRQELRTYFRSLSKSEAALVDAARAGACFGELCEQLQAELGAQAAPARAAALLRAWVAAGLIVATRTA
ncbi:MAG: DNA-binding domain-containing protein [Steroidobacteraceae bacterium]